MAKRAKRSSYPEEFKKKAVLMTEQEGTTLSEVSDQLGVAVQNLSVWRSKYLKDRHIGEAEIKLDAMLENRRLKDELKTLRMENDILKKAASFFASQK